MSKRQIELDLPDEMWSVLDRLVAADECSDDMNHFLLQIVDLVQRGVTHPQSWERGWLVQCVGMEPVEAA